MKTHPRPLVTKTKLEHFNKYLIWNISYRCNSPFGSLHVTSSDVNEVIVSSIISQELNKKHLLSCTEYEIHLQSDLNLHWDRHSYFVSVAMYDTKSPVHMPTLLHVSIKKW